MAQLRKRGMLTAVICSTPFERLGRTQATVLGVPELPLLMIPHPLGGLSYEKVRERADAAIPKIVELLRGNMR